MISIIIPTYNEAKNIRKLLEEIAGVMGKEDYELIVVDDNSPDGTASEAEKVAKKRNVRVIVRKDEKGLSSAVIRGFKEAKGDIIGVMYADLSHPPEKIPELIAKIREEYETEVKNEKQLRKIQRRQIS